MGTELMARAGSARGGPLEELNLTHLALVRGVHLDYIRAGAEIIQTNTFAANTARLGAAGLAERADEINRKAVAVAHEARRLTGQDIWIAGSMGPLGRDGLTIGALDSAASQNAFAQQAAALIEAGVDLIMLETFTSLSEMKLAIQAVRSVASIPIVAQMTFTDDGVTPMGESPEEVAVVLDNLRLAAIGGNCSVGPEQLLQVIERMAISATTPLSSQPNAGLPTYVDGKLAYTADPAYTAERARRAAEAGAVLLGGCCGTTPGHIAAIRDNIRGVRPPRGAQRAPAVPKAPVAPSPPAPTARRHASALAERLARKQFVATMEVDPPRGFDISETVDKIRGMAGHLHAVNVADSPRAQGRMSALAMCSLIQSRLGIETVMHMAIRNRNMVALHSDLLGAHALGVRNIFTVMGDVPVKGDYPQATAVSDITTSGLIKLIAGFNRGVDANERPIDQPTSFVIGCALNLNAPDLDQELRVLERKVRAGAHFILTQPVFDAEVVERVANRLGGFPLPLLLGVLPLRTMRHATFLHHEVPGIRIPDAVFKRMEESKDAAATGIAISKELLLGARPHIAGAYFMPPFHRYQVVGETLDGLRLDTP